MSASQWLSVNDPNSFANHEDVAVIHMDLELDVDFEKQILKGSVILNLERKNVDASILVLDTRDVKVESVIDPGSKQSLTFTVAEPQASFGSKLQIQLPNPELSCVQVYYETSPSCTALQWLAPEQTAGKQHPYLFSQCQAIHCRSLVPCQDTPAVKTTYSAKISAPSDLVVLMSAVKQGTTSDTSLSGRLIHNFHQKVPIPSYLLAIVAGALHSRDIGPRSKVWSEKEMVDEAAHEFAETEEMIQTAEALLGPYVWGVYDLLVLPPSFPFGGMENPCLTFVTPTLLAGDRSLANVVAHEITHSWMGNLVTTSNWEHFWLNEGHTVFVERKILSRMSGEPHRHLSAIGGWKSLKYQVEDVWGTAHPYTHLVPDLSGVDPDDAFGSVPYEKGSNLLMYLEGLLGGAETFEAFLRSYVDKFKYKSISTQDWKDYLYEYFSDKKDILDGVDWDAWFHKPGMPPVKPDYDTSLADAYMKLVQRWSQCSEDDLDSFHGDDLQDMSARQITEFLTELIDEPVLSHKKISKLDQLYGFGTRKNSEIRFKWLRLCLRACVPEAVAASIRFINEQGRMKFVRPIYRDLYQWESSRQQAVDNFVSQRPSMHSMTATMVGKDLKLTG